MLFLLYNCICFIRFDAIVSADAFENLKPAPDIFLAASRILNVPPSEVYAIRLSLLSEAYALIFWMVDVL